MKRIILLLTVVGVAGLLPMAAQAIEPAYTGPFGNGEEPALRPYKWFWSGIRALGRQTKHAFIRGNMNTPVIGSVETMRGVRKGALELTESSFKGMTFAPVQKGRHLETHKLNAKVDEDPALSEISDFVVTRSYYPVLKVVDHRPLEDDEAVQIRLDEAKRVREAREEAEDARESARTSDIDLNKSVVRKAQERRLGDRIPFSGANGRAPSRNLLKLAE